MLRFYTIMYAKTTSHRPACELFWIGNRQLELENPPPAVLNVKRNKRTVSCEAGSGCVFLSVVGIDMPSAQIVVHRASLSYTIDDRNFHIPNAKKFTLPIFVRVFADGVAI